MLSAAVLLLGLLLALYKRWQQVPNDLDIYLKSCGTGTVGTVTFAGTVI
jgi:hypothetical protein